MSVKSAGVSGDHFCDEPQHSTEGGLSPTDEVAITGNHQLPLLSVVLRDIRGLPVERNKAPSLFGAKVFCKTQTREHENVHAGIWAAAFVVAAVELPFPVQNRLKVLALHPRYQTIASARRSPAKTNSRTDLLPGLIYHLTQGYPTFLLF